MAEPSGKEEKRMRKGLGIAAALAAGLAVAFGIAVIGKNRFHGFRHD